MKRRRLGLVLLAGLALLLLIASGAGQARSAKEPEARANRTILFSSDGMRPDLMERYAAAGAMPTYRELMKDGVTGDNGLEQAFPPNTGVGWYTLATGTWPSEHGSTNNTFHRTGDAFTNSTSFSGAGVLQADTIANAAERAGKKVAQIDWVGGRSAAIQGPTVDFANFFSTRGVLAAPVNTTEQAGAASFGISYQVASIAPASGWTNTPASGKPLMQTVLTVATTFAAQNPTRVYDILVYAAGSGYDHVLLVPSAAGKDASKAAVTLGVGDFKEIKLRGADGLIGPARAGQTAAFYTKLIKLSPDLSSFKLYFTSVARAIATCGTACASLPAGGTGEDRLEKYIADNLPGYIAADFAPLEARIIDEDTYVEQGRDLEAEFGDAVLRYVLGTLQKDTDLALVGYPVTDEFSHQFMALTTPTDMDGNPNPFFDDVEGDGVQDGLVAKREGFIRSAYHEADAKLALARQLMGGEPTTVASSDHGFAPQWLAVNARQVLADTKIGGVSIHPSGATSASNCRTAAGETAKACWAGGTAQIYVNPTLPSGMTYEGVRTAVIDAFQSLQDPAAPSRQVVLKIMKKEELRNVEGTDALHPNRSGDVVVVLRPPYQFDAATAGKTIAPSRFFGQHGYLPNLVDLAHNVNLHATFVASGKGFENNDRRVEGMRAIDVAPTLSFLMGTPGPQNARGKIRYDIVKDADNLREVTILDISDYHGQLIPLSEASDTLGPTFGIGGAAFLKPWFDLYRADAKDGSITIAGGDSVGATPPISSFFGDKPTIELMNAMGFGADGLGNHNFDRGQAYLRTQLIPLAKYPFLSANVVDASGKTPAEWSPSKVFKFERGVKVAFVGFTNDDAPTLVSPTAFSPFHVAPSTAAVNATVAGLKKNVDAVVAFGHLGATAGTLTAPTGPLVDLADNVSGVDAVVGDHTDVQVVTTRVNGVLVTENRSKGIRFTRIRLVIDKKNGVVYKTADFHKPWDIGIVPDGSIQARINELNASLAPILGGVIGYSTRFIPRADACGTSNGRTCESLVGNVTADSMRTTYSTDFAITNSGGLRADLTCPTTDNPSDFCPAYTPPPFPITRGQVLTVLPFGNVAVTAQISGSELKTMLENGISRMPAIDGRFPQVSGLCFTYNIAAPVGSRVTGAVRQAADGSCTGLPIDLTSGSYTIAENDFMAAGGDGYPVITSRVTTRNIMDQVLADYITAKGTISPAIQGRIKCVGTCPTVTP